MRQTKRETDRQKDRQTERQKDRDTYRYKNTNSDGRRKLERQAQTLYPLAKLSTN